MTRTITMLTVVRRNDLPSYVTTFFRVSRAIQIATYRSKSEAKDPIPFELSSREQSRKSQPPKHVWNDHEHDETLSPHKPRATLTPMEREIFGSIFSEIATKPKHARDASLGTGNGLASSQIYDNQQTLIHAAAVSATREPAKTAEASVRNIFGDAAGGSQLRSRSPFEHEDPSTDPSLAPFVEGNEFRPSGFPSSLRGAASWAFEEAAKVPNTSTKIMTNNTRSRRFGHARDRSRSGNGSSKTMTSIDSVQEESNVLSPQTLLDQETHQRREMTRIRARMIEAGSDFALWKTLEAEVFPLIQGSSTIRAEASKHTKSRLQLRQQRERERSHDKIVNGALGIEVYGPIFSTLVLEALDYLENRFQHPSPLVVALLPRIKELGLASFMVGIGTAFYNRLLSILLYRYGDFKQALAIVEDMRQAEIQPDEETQQMVQVLSLAIKELSDEESRPFAHFIARLPENEAISIPTDLSTEQLHAWDNDPNPSLSHHRSTADNSSGV